MASAEGRGRTFLPPTPRVEEPYRLTPQMALRVAVLGGVVLLVFARAVPPPLGAAGPLGPRTTCASRGTTSCGRSASTRRAGRSSTATAACSSTTTAAPPSRSGPRDLPDKWYLRLRELKRLSKVVHVPVKEMLKGIAERKGDPLTPVIVKEPVDERQIIYLKEHQYEFRGLTFQDSFLRHYPARHRSRRSSSATSRRCRSRS